MKVLTEPDVYRLLKEHSAAVPEHLVIPKGQEPEWEKFPAYVKVVSEAISHKSSAGGVIRVNSRQELLRALKELEERFPEAEKFLIVEEVKGVEAFVGVKRDRAFLHVIGAGLGGVFVEVLKDVVFLPTGLKEEEKSKKLKETKLYALIGEEGLKSLLNFLKKVETLVRENPQIKELDLNPTIISKRGAIPVDGFGIIEPPEERKEFRPLEAELFRPKSIAVIGASPKPHKVGFALLRNLESFKGEVYPVNPKYKEILGFKCYPSVKELPKEVDCALVAVPPREVLKVARECGEKGVKLLVVITAGFKEAGREEAQRELLNTVKKYRMRLLGPNTLGFIVPSLSLNASFAPITPPPGEISFISQSGALITSVIDRAVEEGMGFSEVISLGNQADIETAEAVELATRREETRVILSYVEGIELGRELLEFLDKKPAVFIKAGRGEAGRRATSSHTGALAGQYRVFKDAVESKGGIVAESITEALDLCQLLKVYGKLKGKNLVIITNAGGPGALATDYAEEMGLELYPIGRLIEELSRGLPENWSKNNPIDILGDATSHRYRAVFNVLNGDKGWDFALVIVTPQAMTDIPQIAMEISKFKQSSKRPVIACLMGGHQVKLGREILKRESVPVYDEPYRAVRALAKSTS